MYIPLLLIPLIDQIAKSMSNSFVLNQDFMMNMFSSLPLFYKSIFAISVFFVIFAFYIFVSMLLIPDVSLLRLSSSTYLAGMLSNCFDKMLFLGVRDHFNFFQLFHFNLADVFQWISLPILIFSLFYYSEKLWSDNCLRKSFFLGAKSQLRIAKNFGAIILLNIFLVLFFFSAFLKYIHVSQDVIELFLKSFFIYSFAIILLSFMFTLIYSQRIVGPFISFIQFIKNKKHHHQKYKIRKGDPLTELEEIAEILNKEHT